MPLDHDPGTTFVYNSGATYLLSAIISKLTNQTMLDYLTPRLLRLLNIEGATWQTNSEGVNVGGWGLKIRAGDAAAFGQFYLQKGEWNGQQLLSAAWVDEATREHIRQPLPGDPDWIQGYGYQFWRCQHGIYRGDGAFGQYCIVMNELDAVLVMFSGIDNDDLQQPLDAAWSTLLPAFQASPLNEDPDAYARLRSLCDTRSIALPRGNASPVCGTFTFALTPNDAQWKSVHVEVTPEVTILRFDNGTDATTLNIGHNDWLDSATLFTSFGGVVLDVRSRGVWETPTKLSARMAYVGEPFTLDFSVELTHGAFEFDGASNVGFFKPAPRTQLSGKA
jgi:Beta-lactamase